MFLTLFLLVVENVGIVQKKKRVKVHKDEMLHQFLMWLNDTFIGVRSNILLSSPLSTIDKASFLIIQDKKNREKLMLLLITQDN